MKRRSIKISTIGTKVLYCISFDGTRPTNGYKAIPCIVSAPAIDSATELIDCSDLGDTITQYLPGRRNSGGDVAFTANLTIDFLDAWDELVEAAHEAEIQGGRVWFEYRTPNFEKSFFWSGIPVNLGHGGLEQNSCQRIKAHVIFNGGQEWGISADEEETLYVYTGTDGLCYQDTNGEIYCSTQEG